MSKALKQRSSTATTSPPKCCPLSLLHMVRRRRRRKTFIEAYIQKKRTKKWVASSHFKRLQDTCAISPTVVEGRLCIHFDYLRHLMSESLMPMSVCINSRHQEEQLLGQSSISSSGLSSATPLPLSHHGWGMSTRITTTTQRPRTTEATYLSATTFLGSQISQVDAHLAAEKAYTRHATSHLISLLLLKYPAKKIHRTKTRRSKKKGR